MARLELLGPSRRRLLAGDGLLVAPRLERAPGALDLLVARREARLAVGVGAPVPGLAAALSVRVGRARVHAPALRLRAGLGRGGMLALLRARRLRLLGGARRLGAHEREVLRPLEFAGGHPPAPLAPQVLVRVELVRRRRHVRLLPVGRRRLHVRELNLAAHPRAHRHLLAEELGQRRHLAARARAGGVQHLG